MQCSFGFPQSGLLKEPFFFAGMDIGRCARRDPLTQGNKLWLYRCMSYPKLVVPLIGLSIGCCMGFFRNVVS